MLAGLEKQVDDVAASFAQLKSQCDSFEEYLAGSDAEIWLPKFEKQHQEVALAAVAKEMCVLWLPDSTDDDQALPVTTEYSFDTTSGVIVCDAALNHAAVQLNAAKETFFTAMMALRDELKLIHGTHINNIRYLHAEMAKRDQRLGEELSKLGLARLDLTSCYRKIRILPKNLRSVSWTWASNHTAVKDISRKELLKLIESEIEGDTKEKMIRTVASLPESTHFARKFEKQPQLRANLTYLDGTKGHQIQISGVCLVEEKLPGILRWANPPDKLGVRRIDRSDQAISRDGLFDKNLLNIYLYEKEGKAAKRRKGELNGGADEPTA